jgi:hypothetical protein
MISCAGSCQVILSFVRQLQLNACAGMQMVIGIFPMRRKTTGADNAYRTD